nr:poly-gamma-glutamate biosynthesis protein PgsC [candidate division Zixibacteria bacterium]
MIYEFFFIGLVIGFLYYEMTGISPGGVVPPAYFALYIHQPNKIIMTLVLAVVVWLVIEWLGRTLIVYGRRRLLLALLLGFCLKLAIERWLQPIPMMTFDLQSIGYIIPGLIANEMSRQKAVPTLASLGIVTILIYLVILLIR